MKILIVEDERITALDLEEIMTELGHEVTTIANTYNDALLSVKTHPPDLALIDISLNGDKDGLAFAQMLREQFNVTIVFVTAYADAQTLKKVKEIRPNGFVVKPFTKDSIFAAIELGTLDHVATDLTTEPELPSVEKLMSQSGLPRSILMSVLDYIEKRFNRELPISELAEAVDLSEDYFSAQFKKSVGVSPHQYIMHKRLDEAQHLLRYTELGIGEVANMVGYTNHAYFATIFKRHFGVTPSRYKRG